LIGRYALNPLTGGKVPILADEILVDPAFGSGCVKITPAHDQNDLNFCIRHGISFDSEGLFDADGNFKDSYPNDVIPSVSPFKRIYIC
jgi:valyl-tRNA synthetase